MKILDILPCQSPATTDLSPLVDQIVKASLPSAVRNRSLIINDIPAEFDIVADKDLVALTLNGILTTFITYAEDSCIRISAERIFSNMVQINIKDNNSNNSYAVACALQKIVPLAEKMGGHLNITNRRQKITTISFMFPVVNETQVQLQKLKGAA